MGFWRTHEFISQRAFDSDAQTEVWDLPSRGMLSNLLIEIVATSGSTNQDLYMGDIISKVEVIGNGSTVIKSYDGRQCQAIACYDNGYFPPDKEYTPSGDCWGYFNVAFGRWPGDERYALNCGDWQSLELKITYDLAAGGTLGTTGFTTGTGYLTVWGLYAPVDAGFTPTGFIRSEEKKTYTTSAGGTEDLDLPSDFPYRRLMLFTETHGKYPNEGFRYVTINVNNGARKPMDRMEGDNLLHWLAILQGHGFYSHAKRYYLDNTAINYIHPPLRWVRHVNITRMFGTGGEYLNVFDPNVVEVNTIADSGSGFNHMEMQGYCPWGCINLDLEKISGGLDGEAAMQAVWGASLSDDINLEFEELTADVALSIVLEQYARR
jgi:hypothetical protein